MYLALLLLPHVNPSEVELKLKVYTLRVYVCTNRLLSGVMVAVIRKKKKKSWECQGDVRIVGLFSLRFLKEKV